MIWRAVSFSLLLMGCSHTDTKIIVAPPVVDYSKEVQKKAAAELKALGPPCPRDAVYGGCSALSRFTIDYKWTRDKLRAIK